MFPLQQSNELCFGISSNPHHQHKISQDLILSCALTDGVSDLIAADNNMGTNQRRKVCGMGSTTTSTDHHQDFGTGRHGNNDKKKMQHRDIERQRRQEMATLYSSLRSLLPLEFIKGKRSISDHMNEAVNYIKNLQKNIKELSIKRDRLKQFDSSTVLISPGSINSTDGSSSSLSVRQSLVGVEIMFSSSMWAQSLRVSTVLHVILEEGLSVLSCTSAKVDDKLFHTIQAEVDDPARFNLSVLRDKLSQLK